MEREHVAVAKLAAKTDRQQENTSDAYESSRDGRHWEAGEFLLINQAKGELQ